MKMLQFAEEINLSFLITYIAVVKSGVYQQHTCPSLNSFLVFCGGYHLVESTIYFN